MRGDALTTAGSATLEFSIKISEVDDEGIFAFSRQCEEEIGAIQSGDLCRLFLGDITTFVPVDCSRETHLVSEFVRRTSKRRKHVFIQFHRYFHHGSSPHSAASIIRSRKYGTSSLYMEIGLR